ncbi:MAG: dihydrodipicolinate synthase family protein, partial [Mycobacteriales bacterium]
ISPAVAGRLAAHPAIVGMKDSSGDVQHLTAVAYATENADFGVYTGTDALLSAALQSGAIGTIAASVNLVPTLAMAIYDAVRAGDPAAADGSQRRLFDIVTACRRGGIPVGWKAALQLAGVCDATLAAPAIGLSKADHDALRADLTRLDVDGTLGIAGRS